MSQSKVTLTVRAAGDSASIVDIHGEVNAFAENAEASSGGRRTIVLNFSGMEYMNSSGIGLLVTMLIRANRQGQRLLACGLSEHYQHIFQLTRLDEAIRIFDNETQALSAAQAG